MNNYERQAAEIATIKPRTFTLELSDADVKRLYEKTAADGITPAELLQGFIGDLLDGTYTHGSDERELASAYYDRCCYEFSRTGSLLEWALYDCRLDDIADALEQIDDAAGDLEYYKEHPEAIPASYQIFIERGDPLPIVVSDYISGMTDQYAIQKYEEYFVPKGWTD